MVRKQVPTSVATVVSLVRLFGHQTLRINLMMHRTMGECLHSTIKTIFVALDSLLCVIVYLLPAIGATYWEAALPDVHIQFANLRVFISIVYIYLRTCYKASTPTAFVFICYANRS